MKSAVKATNKKGSKLLAMLLAGKMRGHQAHYKELCNHDG